MTQNRIFSHQTACHPNGSVGSADPSDPPLRVAFGWFNRFIIASVLEWKARLAVEPPATVGAAASQVPSTVASGDKSVECPAPRRSAADIMDAYFGISEDVFTLKDLAIKASPFRRKLDGAGVTPVSITRIRNGLFVGKTIRQAVATVINERVPCTRDDLLPPDSGAKKR